MKKIRNILFIMADQLRWDYLSCYGHPHLKTPHIDGLAKKGVQFESAFVQSPVCGPSRASYYTGRTVSQVVMTSIQCRSNIVDLATASDRRRVLIGKIHRQKS